MEKQINKSKIMSKAWELYKAFDNQISSFETEMSFSECLTEAWALAKMTIEDVVSDINSESVATIQSILINKEVEFTRILTAVSEKSTGYQADIAAKGLKFGRLSEKQAWCVAYEFKNIA